jgi:hypothetical protein
MRRILLLLTAFAVAAIPSTVAAQSSLGKETLKGLKGIFVSAEDLDQDVEQRGLTKSQIVTDVELRLRKAGIRVPTEPESFADDVGTLMITVSTKERDGLYAYFVSVDLSEAVRLARTPTNRAFARTYLVAGNIGTVGASNVRQIRNIVNDMIDTLTNDYLAMNPKP